MKNVEDDDMRKEYDFSVGVRGKYARRYAQGFRVELLKPQGSPNYPGLRKAGLAVLDLLKLLRESQNEALALEARVKTLVSECATLQELLKDRRLRKASSGKGKTSAKKKITA